MSILYKTGPVGIHAFSCRVRIVLAALPPHMRTREFRSARHTMVRSRLVHGPAPAVPVARVVTARSHGLVARYLPITNTQGVRIKLTSGIHKRNAVVFTPVPGHGGTLREQAVAWCNANAKHIVTSCDMGDHAVVCIYNMEKL